MDILSIVDSGSSDDMFNDATVDMTTLINDCRDLGNKRFAEGAYQRAEEAFALGLSMYELYGDNASVCGGTGCLLGLADSLRAQSKHAEAEALLSSAKRRLH